jgi:hypothetical protein
MENLSGWFLRLAVLYALIGMGLGIGMGIAHDFRFASAHAHINLLGWVSMAVAGLFYRSIAVPGRLAQIHFALANLGMLLFVPAIAALAAGYAAALPLAIVGSFTVVAAMALFAVIVFRATGRRPAGP